MSEQGRPYEDRPSIPAARPEPPSDRTRTLVAIVCALAVAGTAVAAVVYSTGSGPGPHTTPATLPTGRLAPPTTTPSPPGSGSPTAGGQSAAPDAQTGAPQYGSPSADTFNWQSLNDSRTDATPFTQDALLPQQFVDAQGITYAVEAAGEKKCVQSTMAQAVQDVLNEYGCKEAITGSYLVDSSVDKVSSNNDILVSVQVWAFPDATTASKVEKLLAGVGTKQFSIWCPTSGAGAAPCNSQNFYNAATWWSLQSDYRYVVEATAVYTNMTQNKTVAYKWEKTATTAAVKEVGPQVYAKSQ